ncbi:hypothetical protein MKW94_017464 [Papaver nudicaule]|uniref:Cyclin-like domain-containing protein n=1 Tax=Papaver nudicaule TaxID=74823 RepID=A0AA41S1S0_PAPNU|nr:hypothetical protein [Papaver nudicaule]
MEETYYCSDCKRFAPMVSDRFRYRVGVPTVSDDSAGDTICVNCGLILEPHSINETSEGRTFANESVDNDPHRVGEKSNGGGLTTKPKGGGGENRIGRNVKMQDPDKSLFEAFKAIGIMSERLGLVSTIKDLANEIYMEVGDVKSSKGKNKDALVAACLYVACKKEGNSRTIKEIWGVANGATRKGIGRAIDHINKHLEEDVREGVSVNAGDYLRHFCSHLGMNSRAVKAAQEAFEKTAEFDFRRSPITVAASVLFMITQVSEERKLILDVSAATGVAENTIKKSYKEIYPYASLLVPAWFANKKDLMMLCSP